MKYTEESVLKTQILENYKKYYSNVFKIITEEDESNLGSNLLNSEDKLKISEVNGIFGNSSSIQSIDN